MRFGPSDGPKGGGGSRGAKGTCPPRTRNSVATNGHRCMNPQDPSFGGGVLVAKEAVVRAGHGQRPKKTASSGCGL